jgi:hypothetical protein
MARLESQTFLSCELEGSWAHAGSGSGGQSQPEVLVLANMRPALIHSRTSVRLLRTFFRIHVFVATACAPMPCARVKAARRSRPGSCGRKC